ncbi:hypothetical protein [Helicobacter felis]|uniref:Lipoprotein n=1 Tax=Helicobacter felis (strain ATCC 49179 / CCUG 28539 / NCTC 12436 / CS1) TaxID=936155 RepID=E7ABY9_HELFC|nr:hypothetical protein [Helicobacter felis]CBY82958.1 predicted protein [Helicobacter felis ATCC 49179]
MHKKVFLAVAGGVLGGLFFAGCSPVIDARVQGFQYTIYFNANDFEIGRSVTAEIPYDPSNPHIYEMLLNKAIAANKCDTIVFPRYEIIGKTFGRDRIRLTGRVATYKGK